MPLTCMMSDCSGGERSEKEKNVVIGNSRTSGLLRAAARLCAGDLAPPRRHRRTNVSAARIAASGMSSRGSFLAPLAEEAPLPDAPLPAEAAPPFFPAASCAARLANASMTRTSGRPRTSQSADTLSADTTAVAASSSTDPAAAAASQPSSRLGAAAAAESRRVAAPIAKSCRQLRAVAGGCGSDRKRGQPRHYDVTLHRVSRVIGEIREFHSAPGTRCCGRGAATWGRRVRPRGTCSGHPAGA